LDWLQIERCLICQNIGFLGCQIRINGHFYSRATFSMKNGDPNPIWLMPIFVSTRSNLDSEKEKNTWIHSVEETISAKFHDNISSTFSVMTPLRKIAFLSITLLIIDISISNLDLPHYFDGQGILWFNQNWNISFRYRVMADSKFNTFLTKFTSGFIS